MNDARSIEQLAQDNARGEDNNESASGEGEEGEQHSSDGDYSSESDASTISAATSYHPPSRRHLSSLSPAFKGNQDNERVVDDIAIVLKGWIELTG
ncbi:hypothetical protein Tco_0115468 [Tanacetum coccineum]